MERIIGICVLNMTYILGALVLLGKLVEVSSIFLQTCGKGKISFLSYTEYLLFTEWEGFFSIDMIDAPRLNYSMLPTRRFYLRL